MVAEMGVESEFLDGCFEFFECREDEFGVVPVNAYFGEGFEDQRFDVSEEIVCGLV
jgi:hypothetical protein